MGNWTPGPWTTKPGKFFVCQIGSAPHPPGVWSEFPVAEGEKYPFGEPAADAHLIAAAPDLLEALEAMRVCLDGRILGNGADPTIDHEFWQQCRAACDLSNAALSKSKGETS